MHPKERSLASFFLSPYRPPLPFYLKTLLPWLLKYQVNIRKASRLDKPVADYLKQFTDNQPLIDMIVQHFFKDTPTFFALSLELSFANDLQYQSIPNFV